MYLFSELVREDRKSGRAFGCNSHAYATEIASAPGGLIEYTRGMVSEPWIRLDYVMLNHYAMLNHCIDCIRCLELGSLSSARRHLQQPLAAKTRGFNYGSAAGTSNLH